jgi:hypothetical protein
MTTSHARALVALALVIALPLGCRQILGIEDRELDTSLTDGGTDGGSLSCASYCTSIMATCTDTHQQYASEAACEALCATFPVGAITDTGTNSLGCRMREVTAIAESQELDGCIGAGPGGAGVCGSNCDAFCAGVSALCTAQFTDLGGTTESCLAACQQVPDCGGYDADPNRNDDSMQCRLFHLTSAAVDKNTHCPHTIGEDGKCTPADAGGSTCDAGM